MTTPHDPGAPAIPQTDSAQPHASEQSPQPRATALLARVGNPLPSLLAALVSYAGGIVVSVIILLLALVGLMISGSGNMSDTPQDVAGDLMGGVDLSSSAFNTVVFFLGLPAQLVSMAFFGGYGVHASFRASAGDIGSLEGGVNASVWFMPVLVCAVVLIIGFFAGRRVGARGAVISPLFAWIHAAIGGAAVAVLSSILTFATAYRMSASIGFGSMGISIHAAGFLPFFALFFFVTLAVGLGTVTSRGFPRWWPRVSEFVDAVKLGLFHAGLFSVIAAISMFLLAAISNLGAGTLGDFLKTSLGQLFTLPLFAGTAFAGLGSMGIFSSLHSSASTGQNSAIPAELFPWQQSASVFSLDEWWQVLLAFLLAVVCLAVSALVWAQARPRVSASTLANVTSWSALPVAYFVLGLAAIVGSTVGFSFAMHGSAEMLQYLGIPSTGGYSFAAVAWTPLLGAVVGILIEVLARFAAPFVTPYLPVNLGRFVHTQQPVTDALDHNGPALVTTVPRAVQDAPEAAPTPVAAPVIAETKPLSPKAKKGLLIGGGIAGGLLVVLIGLVVAVNVLSSTVFSPKSEVEDYVAAVKEGRYGDAVSIAPPNIANPNRVLMTNAVGAKAQTPITGYTIGDVQISGETASVPVTLDNDGATQEKLFTLTRKGNQFLIFPKWELESPEYQTLYFEPSSGTRYVINGVEVDFSRAQVPQNGPFATDGEIIPLPVFPGTYTVSKKVESPYVDASTATVTVPIVGEVQSEGSSDPTLNDTGRKRIEALAKENIDGCFKDRTSATISTESCKVSAYAYGQVDGTTGTWTVDEYPTVSVSEGFNDGTWSVQTEQPGQATYAYKAESYFDENAPTDEKSEVPLYLYGTATLDDQGEIVITWER